MMKKISLMLGMIFLLIVSLGSVALADTTKVDLKIGVSEGSGTVGVTYTNEGVSKSASTESETTVHVDIGTSVTITASPKENNLFKNWNGNSQKTSNPITIEAISENTEMLAVFDTLRLILLDVDAKTTNAEGKEKSSNNLKEGGDIRDGTPGGIVDIKVEVKNNFPNDQDIEIEGVVIDVIIEEIDDGEELDADSDDFDLKQGRKKSKDFKFEIPLEADAGDYTVIIRAEGTESESGITHTVEMSVTLEVQKERHEIRITKGSLDSSNVICSRRGNQLDVGIINVGEEDEEDVTLTISNSDLGINFKNTFDLDSGSFDDDIKYSRNYRFDVPEDLGAGVYPINIRVDYDDNSEIAEKTVDLAVEDCTISTTTTTLPPVNDEGNAVDNNVVELIIPPVTGDITQTTTTTVPEEEPTVEEKGLFSNTAFIAVLIGAEVLVALLVIILIVGLTRRR